MIAHMLSATFIKVVRREKNLSQVDMAKALRISQSKVSKLEKGQLEMTVSEFFLLLGIYEKRKKRNLKIQEA